MSRLIYPGLALIILLSACSGKDRITVDTIPPTTPIMIPHIGDLGDNAVLYNDQYVIPNEDNNGIDAVPDGDWFRISWEHLLDTDLDYIKIFRFDEFNPVPVVIDSISYNNDFYLDSSPSLSTNRRYSYFIEVVDDSGNSAVSDTVAYKLLSKQQLSYPSNGAYNDSLNLSLCWQKSGFVSKFRVLVFDSDHEYMWHRDIDVAFEGDFFKVSLPNNLLSGYDSDQIYWRVDAFDWDFELGAMAGSESLERVIYVNSGKRKE
jgi:hypothetical protein